MSKVIAQLASTVPSEDLLAQIDIGEVYEKFHATFKRLDEFKRVRDEHERRSVLGRLFNRGELKNAQLDAQEVQAEFSKTLAQLMVISSLQAQQITEQQGQLSEQQTQLKDKAEQLARQNARLEQHQAVIKHQAASLRTYVDNLLKVQGLTEEHGAMLIQIAEEVLQTKDNLLAEFDRRMQQVQAVLDDQAHQARDLFEQHARASGEQLAAVRADVDTRVEQLRQDVRQQVQASVDAQRDEAAKRDERLRAEAAKRDERLRADLASHVQQQQEKVTDVDRQMSELREVLAEQEQALRTERAERQHEATRRQAELDALRHDQQLSETRLRRTQRQLLAGLCAVGLAAAVAASLPWWPALNTPHPPATVAAP